MRPGRAEIHALLVRAADGDRGAFDPLFDAVWPAVQHLCARMAPAGEGDDAAQEAMVRVFTRIAEFDRERDAMTWILAIAAWQCRTVRRTRTRRREDHAAVETEGAERPDDLAERRELIAAATETLGSLSDDDVATITAALTGDPTARAGIAPATFRKRLERAIAKLRAAWRSRYGSP
ncbi:MAG TPA: sigma-70 family RNA polymerase sigma factor [Kofleriaceae bacterium]|nr:sigma-70 family RNA polymerase sigma factor [Kofleriaceae bacterium]